MANPRTPGKRLAQTALSRKSDIPTVSGRITGMPRAAYVPATLGRSRRHLPPQLLPVSAPKAARSAAPSHCRGDGPSVRSPLTDRTLAHLENDANAASFTRRRENSSRPTRSPFRHEQQRSRASVAILAPGGSASRSPGPTLVAAIATGLHAWRLRTPGFSARYPVNDKSSMTLATPCEMVQSRLEDAPHSRPPATPPGVACTK